MKTGAIDRAWHTVPQGDLATSLEAAEGGLSTREAERRLASVGPNRLPEGETPSLLRVLLRQVQSPLIAILALAAAVSVALGEWTDAGFIAAVIVLNAAIGGYQEWRAEKQSRALQHLLRTRATVLRDGEAREIDAEAVVPGDVVRLESGNRVPADLRFLRTTGLEIDESLLTGESLPVHKDEGWEGPAGAALGDRRNMAHAGSTVARGRGSGIVVATGSDTVVGRLALGVTSAGQGKPPLVVRLERFTRVIAVSVVAAAAAVAVLGTLWGGYGAAEMFLFAVALAVSAIPEGLPVAMTVALAVAARRMARRGVIVRRLAAVEGLGSCTMIASDKTGTLTCNELTVRCVVLPDGEELVVSGEGYRPDGELLRGAVRVTAADSGAIEDLVTAAALCNEAHLAVHAGEWSWRGDPTDVALLALAHKAGRTPEELVHGRTQVNQIPFEPERRYAATHYRTRGAVQVIAKGAPERIIAMCAWSDAEARERAHAAAVGLAERGFRVLAFGERELAAELATAGDPPEPEGLRFLGLAGMIDPLRPGARDAVAACRDAGIIAVMITGDHPVTALAIARDLGMASRPEEVVAGADLETRSSADLAEIVRTARVFARTSPQQKLDIVRAAREAGHFVAVTGDGVNDAPALREANIGVAMGRSGTDAAREAAELVLSDDDFGTIVAGVEEGRVAYDNVRKVIYLLISTGAAEVVLVALSLAVGLPLPLLPVQILWLNLVTNGIQDVALAFEPKEHDVLSRAPRPPREPIFNRLMIERTLVAAAVMGVVGFGVFRWLLESGWSEPQARNVLLLLMVLFENVHIGNCRSETRSLTRLSPLTSPILLAGTLLAFLVHLAAMHTPFLQRVLGTQPVGRGTWLALIGLALSVAVAVEVHKLFWRLRGRARVSRA